MVMLGDHGRISKATAGAEDRVFGRVRVYCLIATPSWYGTYECTTLAGRVRLRTRPDVAGQQRAHGTGVLDEDAGLNPV
jgi:hypothetical protein